MDESKSARQLKAFLNKGSSLGLFGISPDEKKELLRKIDSPKERSGILNALKKRMPKDISTFDKLP
jgi:hypothetical protein